jgi:hypothetical protein
MKVVIFSPSDMLTEPVVAGLQTIHAVNVCWYDRLTVPVDREMLNFADLEKPEIIMWIGQNGGPYLPSTDTFIRLRKIAPTVFLLFDGTDVTWEPLIAEYRARDVFSVTVNIDGNRDWAKGPKDLTLLTPTSPHFYQ